MQEKEFHRLLRISRKTSDEAAQIAVQQAAWAEHQLEEATLGNIDSVACPYCGSRVVLGEEGLCCKPMNDAATTLLDRMEAAESGENDTESPSQPVAAEAGEHRNGRKSVQ